jgi:hypothetical protein
MLLSPRELTNGPLIGTLIRIADNEIDKASR